ncbi:MAG: aspartyl protease family protein [Undibacterium sp.]|nr:aspartyl protease family protein [Opitutaceae bacterium]
MNWRRPFALILASLACALLAGCFTFRREAPRPGKTTLRSPLVVLPAQRLGSYLIISGKWDRGGPWHFLIDTGANTTLVTPEFAKRYGIKDEAAIAAAPVSVLSADGHSVELPPITLRRLDLGDARFENISARIYDCAALSAHLGVKIDGILGFPLFRKTLLTLDYPHDRVVLAPSGGSPLIPGLSIPFNNANKTPLIPVRIGDRTFIALLDSGSDAPLSLNPVGLNPKFIFGPRAGSTVSTLSGDRPQRIGRLADTFTLADYSLPAPIVDLSDELSAVGGAILQYFTVTFDQEHDKVTFYRDSPAPIATGARRTPGLSFAKTPAYWRVAGVVPGSPPDAGEVERGDLVTRINGEPVARWDFRRYEQLVARASEISFTFLHGTREIEKRFTVFELVP